MRQARRNEASKLIGGLMKDGKRDEAEQLKVEVREINEAVAELEERRGAVDEQVRELLLTSAEHPA